MRYLNLFCIILFFLAGCEQEDYDFKNNPDVDNFVEKLKDGTYNYKDEFGIVTIPDFNSDDIPGLLRYAEDLTVLPRRYPTASLSSATGPVRLGEAMLWTIEGIRTGNKFPSYSGHLRKKVADNTETSYIDATDKELKAVAKLYRLWWSGAYPFNKAHDKMSIDPLADTPYCWR